MPDDLYFCAICGHEVDDVVVRPLGKRGGMVDVCFPCEGEAPVEHGPYIQDGFQPGGGLPTQQQATAGARKAMGDVAYELAIKLDVETGRAPIPTPLDQILTADPPRKGQINKPIRPRRSR